MAKAVTLKDSNSEEVYPVTDISLVNGNIDTGRIADGAVTSSKIDWSTLRYFVAGNDGTSVQIATSDTTILSIANVPAGTYHVLAVCSFNRTGSGGADVFMKLFLDSTEDRTLAQMTVSSNWGWVLPSLVGQGVVTISSPKTVSIKAQKGSSDLTALQTMQRGCSLLLIRLD